MSCFPRASALACGVAAALVLPHAPLAQSLPMQPDVVVTADRTAVTVDDTLATVSVITRERIEASGSADLVELLRGVPGLDIVRGGGLGQQSSVFLRGTDANHVLVLIDGVRVAALGTGAYAWEELAIDQIERIEIVRGPRAALWGSDAIGGVIQVFTRRAAAPEGSMHVGSHGSWGGDVAAGWRGARGGFDARLGHAESDGISAQTEDGFAFDPDDDGYRRRHALLRGDIDLGEQRLGLLATQRDNDIEFDQGRSSTRQTQAAATLEGALGAEWSHRLSAGSAHDLLRTPDFFSRYDSRRQQIDWIHALDLATRGELLLGAAYVRERGENVDTSSDSTLYRAHRHNRALFGTWRGGGARHDLEASARHDDNSQFGGESTFSAAWGWQVNDAVRSRLSLGEGFRAPTLNELYSPGFGGLFAGNALLEPEHSRSIEAGVDVALAGDATLGISAYRTRVRDLIDFVGGETFQAINVQRVRIDGVELDAGMRLGSWRLDANATWQDAEDLDSGADLLRRPARKANLRFERGFANGSRVGIEAHGASARPEFGGELPGYGLLSLSARLPLAPGWSLDGRIENLLDRDYVLARGFSTPGITGLLTLRWTTAD